MPLKGFRRGNMVVEINDHVSLEILKKSDDVGCIQRDKSSRNSRSGIN